MEPLFPPINFCVVEEDIYRCGAPTELNFKHLQTLNLKTVILLSDDVDERFVGFLEDSAIRIVYIDNSVNDGLRGLVCAEEMVIEALQCLIDKENLPALVTCRTGKYLTGVVVACLRKLQRWSLISIFEEYRRFSGQKLQQQHEQFIELFDTDLVAISHNSPEFLKMES